MEMSSAESGKLNFPEAAPDALEKLMTCYGSQVLRTAFFYLGDRHLAEDISQEVFLRAYRSWQNFRGDSSVKTWLLKITVNLCRDKLRSKSSFEQPNDPVLLQRCLPVSEDGVSERLNKAVVLKNVLALPLPYQEVLYHYYYLDLTTQKIAEVIGVSEGTIKSRLHRAKERLKELLMKEGFWDE